MTLQQVGQRVGSAGNIAWINADKEVRFTGVSPYADDILVLGG